MCGKRASWNNKKPLSTVHNPNFMTFSDYQAIFLSLLLGIGLSAAAGFRVFVPFLCMGIAAHFQDSLFAVPANFQWTGTLPALILFGTATLFEVAAYYVPWIDNALDSIATPASVIAGSVLTASALSPHTSPMLQWAAGIMVGGTTAGIMSGGTAITRAASSLATGGIANPLLSTSELFSSFIITALALVLPILTGCVILVLLFFTGRFLWKKIWKDRRAAQHITEMPPMEPLI